MKKLPIKLPAFKSLALPANLQKRERLAIAAAIVAVCLFLVLQLAVFPVMDKRENLKNDIQRKTRQYEDMLAMRQQIQELTKNSKDTEVLLSQRGQGFTLFSFLDGLAGKNGIKQNVAYMKPSTSNLKNSPYALSMVEMKLQALTAQQLVTFIHGVETAAQQVWIKRMSISAGESAENLLNAVLQVETYQR